MPTVQLINGADFLYCHSAIKEEAFENGYNPFPNKSLCIALFDDSNMRDMEDACEQYYQLRDLIGRERMEMSLFLIDHGHNLTSLALHKIKVKPAQLHKILDHLPNVKTSSMKIRS